MTDFGAPEYRRGNETADEIERLRIIAKWAYKWYWSIDRHDAYDFLDSLGCAVVQLLGPPPDEFVRKYPDMAPNRDEMRQE